MYPILDPKLASSESKRYGRVKATMKAQTKKVADPNDMSF
jgi:hypothetical protein